MTTRSLFSLFLTSFLFVIGCQSGGNASSRAKALINQKFCRADFEPIVIDQENSDVSQKMALSTKLDKDENSSEQPLETGNYEYNGVEVYFVDEEKNIRLFASEIKNRAGKFEPYINCAAGLNPYQSISAVEAFSISDMKVELASNNDSDKSEPIESIEYTLKSLSITYDGRKLSVTPFTETENQGSSLKAFYQTYGKGNYQMYKLKDAVETLDENKLTVKSDGYEIRAVKVNGSQKTFVKIKMKKSSEI